MKMESMIDRPVQNRSDAAEDLLVRVMVLKGDLESKRLKDMKNLFQSAGIIHRMIEKNLVAGKTNNEVYDVYFKVARGLGCPAITKDFLMKALKNYYGFEIVSFRRGKKIVRILVTNDSEYSISHSKVQEFLDKFNRSELLGRKTREVFTEYKAWCTENDIPSVTPDVFSKMVKAAHGVNIRNKRIEKRMFKCFCD